MVATQAESVLGGSPYRVDCLTRRILDRIGDRWTVLIVGALWEPIDLLPTPPIATSNTAQCSCC